MGALDQNRLSVCVAIVGLSILLVSSFPPSLTLAQGSAPTPDLGAGPNHLPGAPYRAKLSPPFAEGTVLVVKGQVYDSRSGEPIVGAVLDAYHADHNGNYDTKGFNYRARILTDERGYYEFETIRPHSYGPAPHIHFIITADGYRLLRTEMLFRDESHPSNNHPELTPKLVERTTNGRTYLEGEFNITLIPNAIKP